MCKVFPCLFIIYYRIVNLQTTQTLRTRGSRLGEVCCFFTSASSMQFFAAFILMSICKCLSAWHSEGKFQSIINCERLSNYRNFWHLLRAKCLFENWQFAVSLARNLLQIARKDFSRSTFVLWARNELHIAVRHDHATELAEGNDETTRVS